ncbi:uncharacterized protein EV422DRAFT_567529 [Fimicolochytrium jonesii]|uniref:uncharacterized protein n=1 Tax=Fimicolochytrium jonesii TaxID=1396493 RepID=UPI0022FDD238|nr:uncharacterized protein EV422DRAFT_567529 [Fimicolochytrium jonesii]KAI8820634.1 hypothetical protein EV422DRAFT_567529 [Fimicolochytrium jonesii]
MSPNIGLLATTTTLHLCCNSLTEIPLEIGYLRNLTHLHISNNKLTTLPDTLGYLTKLVELHASDNRITTLPSSIASLKKLTVLDLKRNEISALPSEMGELKSLVTLELADNPINQLPAEITRLKFLRKIGLDNCPLDLDVLEDHADELATPPTLRELAARVIVRQQLPILEITHDHLKHYLASAQSCTSCAGPYFESTIIRRRVVTRNEVQIPLEYKLCTRHWESDHGRVAAMFCPPPETAPTPPTSLPSSPFSSPPGSPLLERRRKSSMRAGSLSSSTLPLSSLAKTPILPSLPPEASAVEARGLKTTLLLKRGALRSSRSLSFISLPAGRSQ